MIITSIPDSNTEYLDTMIKEELSNSSKLYSEEDLPVTITDEEIDEMIDCIRTPELNEIWYLDWPTRKVIEGE